MNTSRRTPYSQGMQAVEPRLAARLAGALSARSETVPHDISERLRFAREQAVARARESRLQTATPVVLAASDGGTGVLMAHAPWWQRAASVLPLLVLVAGLLAIDRWAAREQMLAAAEIDSQLLSDNLPPSAYSDPGFAEYLRSAPP